MACPRHPLDWNPDIRAPRRLVTPSEILADARSDEQFVFVTGRKPLRCALYFRRPEMSAQVGANRFAPQGDDRPGRSSAM